MTAFCEGKEIPGRYQLFQGYYTQSAYIKGEAGESDKKAIMKIDTATGDTWLYTDTLIADKNIGAGQSKGWQLIDGKFKGFESKKEAGHE
jgi:hypothetical protein